MDVRKKSIILTMAKAVAALVLGVMFGLLVNALILTRLSIITLSQTNKLTVAIAAVSAVFFYGLLYWLTSKGECKSWVSPVSIGISLVASLCLVDLIPSQFFSGTFISLFLPENTVRVVVHPIQEFQPGSATLSWATRSIGDISFQSFTMQGWTVEPSGITLQAEQNWLEWSGVTGPRMTLDFNPIPPGSDILFYWNNAEVPETWHVKGVSEAIINKDFKMPFVATQHFVQWLFSIILASVLLLVYALGVKVVKEQAVSHPKFGMWVKRWQEKINEAFLTWQSDIHDEVVQPGFRLSKGDWLTMAGFVVVTLIFRTINLDQLALSYDEYFHLQAAKDIIGGAALTDVYSRSLYPVTLPMTLSSLLMGITVFSARFPGVIASALALIPLYILVRQFGRSATILACFLYMTHPLITALARFAREYAYQPFFFYLVILGMLYVLRQLPTGYLIQRDWKRVLKPDVLITLLLLGLTVVYCIAIDRFSTFRLILPAFGLFALFLVVKMDLKDKKNLVFLGVVVIALGLLLSRYWSYIATFQFDPYVLNYQFLSFSSSSVEHWYYAMPIFAPLFGIAVSIWIGIKFRDKYSSLLFITLLVILYLVLFNSLFSDAYRNRYTISIDYWVLIIISVGVSAIWKLISIGLRGWFLRGLVLVGILASFMNLGQILKPITYSGEFLDITNQSYYRMDLVDEYIRDHGQPTDALVATVYYKYVNLKGAPKFIDIDLFSWKSEDPTLSIYQQMAANKTGWVVLDYARGVQFAQPLPLESTVINDLNVTYIGQFDSQYVWYWEKVGD